MIGTGPLVSASGAVLLAAALVGGGRTDPGTSIRADALVDERRGAALAALDRLAAELDVALDAARDGSQDALDGGDAAGHSLLEAAEIVDAARDDADAAQDALDGLYAAQGARGDPGSRGAVVTADLHAIAEDLRVAAPAADAAAEVRREADGVLTEVDAALAALVEGAHDDAARAAERARAHHDVVSASSTTSDVLPVWLEATDAMINAVTTLIEATVAGDRESAAAAAADFAAIAEDAATADRALGIATAEAADAATAAGLARIGSAIASVERTRAALVAADAAP